jgi:hypothetical protein
MMTSSDNPKLRLVLPMNMEYDALTSYLKKWSLGYPNQLFLRIFGDGEETNGKKIAKFSKT